MSGSQNKMLGSINENCSRVDEKTLKRFINKINDQNSEGNLPRDLSMYRTGKPLADSRCIMKYLAT